jgi:uncharacterized membrane protein YkvA (DUF1232 family)
MGNRPSWFERLKGWARVLKTEAYALYLAARDPRTPWYAKLLAGLVVAYTFSPIDLIPDFIPLLGYLDDLLIVPAGIGLALKLIPADVMSEKRDQARVLVDAQKPVSWGAAVVIILLWLALLAWVGMLIFRTIRD